MRELVPDDQSPRTPARHDGYAPIEDYAVIGNRRSAALVALDGSIDWLCLPRFDSPSVFGALLDPALGGRWALQPTVPFESARRYAENTNLLETTFVTDSGSVVVRDVMTRATSRPIDWNEIVREVECNGGQVPLRWRVEPRLDFKGLAPEIEDDGETFLLRGSSLHLALRTWDAGTAEVRDGGVECRLTLAKGESALLVLSSFHDRPIALAERDAVEHRIEETRRYWGDWDAGVRYDGPWAEAVHRSALALQVMVHEPDASMIAAVTSSLPERIGGDKNYDYRYAWVRDTTFAMDSLVRIGYPDEVHGMLTWLLHTARRTHPRVHTFYGLDGRVHDSATELTDWAGYRGSQPVRAGNDAGAQLQLGNFGDILQTTWLFIRAGHRLDPQSGEQIADIATLLCDLWRNEDSCIWELDERHHYTQSKLAAWLCFHRAIQLAEEGQVPDVHMARWRREAQALRAFIDEDCFDAERGIWTRMAGGGGLDAAVLLIAGMDYVAMDDPRLHATIDAIRAGLCAGGPLLYRYSGVEQAEGAFLACSFWLVEALARAGRIDEGIALMDELVALGNDVGLYSEQLDPVTGNMLGNFPQALTHLSLITAAFTLEQNG
jgi:GH15 family glucan-1,4-alpha-glucosidase